MVDSPEQKASIYSKGLDQFRLSTPCLLSFDENSESDTCSEKDSQRTPQPGLDSAGGSSFFQSLFPKNELARGYMLQSSMLMKDPQVPSDLAVYTNMAARMFKVPLASINFIDAHYVHFFSVFGGSGPIPPARREQALCSYTICDEASTATIFPDILHNHKLFGLPELRFNDQPIQFYAAAPIVFLGYKIGTLNLMDFQPRGDFDDRKRFMLLDLAAIINRYLEERQRKLLRTEVVYAQLMISILQGLKPALTRVLRQKRSMEFVYDVFKQATSETYRDYAIDFADAVKELRGGINQLSTTLESSLSLGMMSVQLKPAALSKRSLSFNPHNALENGLIKWLNELGDLRTMSPHYSHAIHDVNWAVRPGAARCLHVTDISTEACSLIANLLINRNLLTWKTIHVVVDMVHVPCNIDYTDPFAHIRSSKIMVNIICRNSIRTQNCNQSSSNAKSENSVRSVRSRFLNTQYPHQSFPHYFQTSAEYDREATMRFMQQCDIYVGRTLLATHRGGIEHFVKHFPIDEDYAFLEPEIESECFRIWLPCKSICANNPVSTPTAFAQQQLQQRVPSATLKPTIDLDALIEDLGWEHQNPPALSALVIQANTCKKSNIMSKMTQQKSSAGLGKVKTKPANNKGDKAVSGGMFSFHFPGFNSRIHNDNTSDSQPIDEESFLASAWKQILGSFGHSRIIPR